MNTNKLKTFSKNARIILLNGVKQRIAYWGFDKKGNVTEDLTSIEGGYMFRESVFNDPTVAKKWNALKSAVKRHTVEDIIEEAAYTWFNRLIAIKILEKNKYIEPVYEYVSDQLKDPLILQKARKGETTKLREDEKKLLNEYLIESKDEEAFGLLLTAFCRNQKLTNRIFGHIDDYTELLLPNNLLSGGGIIDHINSNDAIEEGDYKEVELIGWLYQFYISDKKDEVFAGFKNKKKARQEDIPAATQIFTPKWIVKYMVENTVGRIWLDLHPDSPIRSEMKYFVEPANKENYKPEPIITSVIELTLMDPASGSGHILVEGFDLIMKMYVEEGYTTKNAVESILKNNLFGLDVDNRAVQLANFAVLLKAAKYYPSILTLDVLPNIYSFPESRELPQAEVNIFLDKDGMPYSANLKIILELLQQGKNLGSVIKLKISNELRIYVLNKYNHLEERFIKDEMDLAEKAFWINLRSYIQIILLISNKYQAVVTNPPYLGTKYMNESLKKYVTSIYPETKADLFAVFVEVQLRLVVDNGFVGIINQWAWMCIDSFKEFRLSLLTKYSIKSLLHLGIGVFPELNTKKVQNVALILSDKNLNERGTYFKLDENFDVKKKEESFVNGDNKYLVQQKLFFNLPDAPIAFWLPNVIYNAYKNEPILKNMINARQGLATGENELFVRSWYEVSYERIGFNCSNSTESVISKKKWFPYNKGGGFRKWFGNNYFVVNWENDGYDIKKDKLDRLREGLILESNSKPKNTDYYFRESITWSLISLNFSARYSKKGAIFDVGGSSGFPDKKNIFVLIALLNSKVSSYFLGFLNFTLNVQVGDVNRILYMSQISEKVDTINEIVKNQLDISEHEWNLKEMSWSVRINPLIMLKNKSIQHSVDKYIDDMRKYCVNYKKNEEEINRIFIEIYGLEKHLDPNISLKNISIFQDETCINEYDEVVFKKDEIINQFISYAIGCMMGRYSLDKEGLILANQEDTLEQFKEQIPNPTFMPDEDGIIPFMGNGCNFSDDVLIRFKHFLEVAFSTETLTENINFIQECLDMDLEKFLTEKFWQYHCKMYQKKPIYWLFSSPKGAFKVLVYMHRMNRFTVQKIRINYLLKHLSYLRNEIAKMEKNETSLSRAEAKLLDKMRSDEMECREYETLVKDSDKQESFDLDDGVSVNYAKYEKILAPIK